MLNLAIDPAQYSSVGLRDQTAELASLALSDQNFGDYSPSVGSSLDLEGEGESTLPEAIEEVSEPTTPEFEPEGDFVPVYESTLTQIIQRSSVSPEQQISSDTRQEPVDGHDSKRRSHRHDADDLDEDENASERTRLLHKYQAEPAAIVRDRGDDPESLKTNQISSGAAATLRLLRSKTRSCVHTLSNPKTWHPKAIWQELVMHPLRLVPAVFLGLLLNILDALSYGMILFPLGEPLFDNLGSDGIAMFYVSTIIAQLVFSAGGSVFRGGVGSEMIEVVPFFHSMAFTILQRVGDDNPKGVLATTILAFSVSAILTGTVFFLMGACRLGSLIGFFPRHILIGCIGGVGWFLVATGIEVSARLSGNLNYNLDTLRHLFRLDTVFLWTTPLALAIVLLIIQRYVKSNFLVGGYFIIIAIVFYFFKFALGIQMETLHSKGWIFDSPPSGHPWYHFYTLYDFRATDWEALFDTVPAMFALTFFGTLHVPINVPALGISTGEDNLNLDRELIAHGISNCLSGCIGSIQNYLVYTNSLLFIDSGGNDRLAGFMLAAATFGVLIAGPTIVGYIPIMVVGALIFLLGIELLQEALVDTYGRLHRLEYVTVIIIVITMGVWDFVFGILVGIILAALSFVVQTSRRTAIRATYTGQIANSTVRRPPAQHRYLREAGQQIFIIKLAGFLFFGTIVSVESRIRGLLEEEAFKQRPLRYLILDMFHINGVDFSAAEAFTRINRLLKQRDVKLVISGLDLDSEIGQALRNVGLFREESEVEIFVDLNEALEHCENKLLAILYRQEERLKLRRPPIHLEVPKPSSESSDQRPSFTTEFMISSPRRNQLHEAATSTLTEHPQSHHHHWQSFNQPLPLMLSIFEDLSDFNEDSWFRAVPYFEQCTFPSGSTIFDHGDEAKAFYLLETGTLRADYDLPQGKYWEVIVPGRPFGELPFFSETRRTAKMVAEKDCVAWRMDRGMWETLQGKEPEVARELLKVSLKLTKERMDVITSYVLTTAG